MIKTIAIPASAVADATEDRFLNGRVVAMQPPKGYRAAIDPVLLAATVPAQPEDKVLELGCGVGIAFLCLAARVPDLVIVGIEKQPELMYMAQENAQRCETADTMMIYGDLEKPIPALRGVAFDHVMANPPYNDAAAHSPSPHAGKNIAHAEGNADLATWIKVAHRHLKPRGVLTMIHRADRLPDILAAMKSKFGGIEIIPLWPKAGEDAKRIILRGRKDSRAPMTLKAGLVLHKADGTYTQDAEAILRDAAPL